MQWVELSKSLVEDVRGSRMGPHFLTLHYQMLNGEATPRWLRYTKGAGRTREESRTKLPFSLPCLLFVGITLIGETAKGDDEDDDLSQELVAGVQRAYSKKKPTRKVNHIK